MTPLLTATRTFTAATNSGTGIIHRDHEQVRPDLTSAGCGRPSVSGRDGRTAPPAPARLRHLPGAEPGFHHCTKGTRS